MAAACNESVVGGSGDHVRDVALIVAVKKVDDENDVFIFKRPDYTAEEWRWLFLTTGSDNYLRSVRLLGFCGVAGINWAVVTRMRERDESANEYYFCFSAARCLFRFALHAPAVPIPDLHWAG